MNFKQINYGKNFSLDLTDMPLMALYNEEQSGKKYNIVEFESLGHLATCIEKNTKRGFKLVQGNANDKNWIFGGVFKNLEITSEHLKNGSAPDFFIRDIEELKAELYRDNPELFELETSAKKKKRKRTFSEDGGELNIDRYMSGEVEMWHKTHNILKKPTAKIFINFSVSGGMKSSDFIKNILCAIALIDILETMNVRCEVYAGSIASSVTDGANYSCVIAKIKSGGDPLDLPRFLSCCAPALLRYYFFMVFENIYTGRALYGLGSPMENSTQAVKNIKEFLKFDAMLSMNDSASYGVTKIKDMLKLILK